MSERPSESNQHQGPDTKETKLDQEWVAIQEYVLISLPIVIGILNGQIQEKYHQPHDKQRLTAQGTALRFSLESVWMAMLAAAKNKQTEFTSQIKGASFGSDQDPVAQDRTLIELQTLVNSQLSNLLTGNRLTTDVSSNTLGWRFRVQNFQIREAMSLAKSLGEIADGNSFADLQNKLLDAGIHMTTLQPTEVIPEKRRVEGVTYQDDIVAVQSLLQAIVLRIQEGKTNISDIFVDFEGRWPAVFKDQTKLKAKIREIALKAKEGMTELQYESGTSEQILEALAKVTRCFQELPDVFSPTGRVVRLKDQLIVIRALKMASTVEEKEHRLTQVTSAFGLRKRLAAEFGIETKG